MAKTAHTKDDVGERRESDIRSTSVETLLVGKPEVMRMINYSRSTLDALVAAGRFPQPIKPNGPNSRRVLWLEAEVRAWVAERVAERDALLAGPNKKSKT